MNHHMCIVLVHVILNTRNHTNIQYLISGICIEFWMQFNVENKLTYARCRVSCNLRWGGNLKKNKTRINCVWQDVIGITSNEQHLDNF